jgi:hypothetical protein
MTVLHGTGRTGADVTGGDADNADCCRKALGERYRLASRSRPHRSCLVLLERLPGSQEIRKLIPADARHLENRYIQIFELQILR